MGPSVDAVSGGLPEVVVMQTAEQRHLDHVPTLW
jgi:hypothetical protein